MKNLTTGHPLKLIFFFALPLMFGNFLQQLYIMVDTMIVGRFVGVDALASGKYPDYPYCDCGGNPEPQRVAADHRDCRKLRH